MAEKSDHDLLVEIHGVVLGTNGQGGLYRQVKENTKAIFRLWVILAIILAGGGGGGYALTHAVLTKAAGG
jgi:hypothetical protein